jgi:hypothetical protein
MPAFEGWNQLTVLGNPQNLLALLTFAASTLQI